MKKTTKILAMILALAMAFSLCACSSGSNFDDDDDDDDRSAKPAKPNVSVESEATEETDPIEETLPEAPSAEEQAVLDAYCENLYNLWCSFDAEEKQMYYEQLKALDLSVIDKWAGTEFEPEEYRYHNINWDYEAVFEAITVVENVVLNQKTTYTDFIGNVSEDYCYPEWSYNADGLITKIDNELWVFEIFTSNPTHLNGVREYTKNDAGQITQTRYGSYNGNGTFSATHLVTLNYDENGNKISEKVTNTYGDTYDILYFYDEENRLIRIECGDSNNTVYAYTYDAEGKLVEYKHSTKNGCLCEDTLVLSYDESGNLVSGVMTYDTWSHSLFGSEAYIDYTREDLYTFTSDENGNVVQIDIVPGNQYYAHGSYAGKVRFEASHALNTITITYGNFIIVDNDALLTIG